MTNMLEESPGVKSSKRLAGMILIATGCLLLVAVGIVALISIVPMVNAGIAISAGTTLVGIGSALLGVTVFEGIGKKLGGAE